MYRLQFHVGSKYVLDHRGPPRNRWYPGQLNQIQFRYLVFLTVYLYFFPYYLVPEHVKIVLVLNLLRRCLCDRFVLNPTLQSKAQTGNSVLLLNSCLSPFMSSFSCQELFCTSPGLVKCWSWCCKVAVSEQDLNSYIYWNIYNYRLKH